ncbi:Hypothetical predicted protein [Olea europaea subsp. europaea]|uniref:Uncharacterized protein n=1 Tax=Olea europaea subsp. europaea TaxID=158383 RepID=A0A8S0RI80_OLEEU|nr:Hypothetical predicted protein [Olea europaea subsp. europaea]
MVTYISQKRIFSKWITLHSVQSMKSNSTLQIQVPVNTSTGFALLSGDISKNLFRDDCTPSNTIPQKSKPVVCCIPTNINAPMVQRRTAQSVVLVVR